MPDLNLQLMDSETGEVVELPELPDDDALEMLAAAEITAAELIPWGSNHTFAVALERAGAPGHMGIYKPISGERPLWDFPHGTLHLRERATYLLSRWLGWDIVPPTIVRDGPYGEGSVQLYMAPDPVWSEDQAFWGAPTRDNERIVLLDHLTNNADRKLGHLMKTRSGRIVGIDHGLTFGVEPKLRTVQWQFVRQPIEAGFLADIQRLHDQRDELRALLTGLLKESELRALEQRIERLLNERRYPTLNPNRNIPWGW